MKIYFIEYLQLILYFIEKSFLCYSTKRGNFDVVCGKAKFDLKKISILLLCTSMIIWYFKYCVQWKYISLNPIFAILFGQGFFSLQFPNSKISLFFLGGHCRDSFKHLKYKRHHKIGQYIKLTSCKSPSPKSR